MSLHVPIRFINDGENINATNSNRALLDIQTNLEELFNRVSAYDGGTSEAMANRVVLRDNLGTAKFGVPTHDQNPWRLADHLEFYDFLIDSAELVRNERLPKASTTLQGIVRLVDSYNSTSTDTAPTAYAVKRLYDLLVDLEFKVDNPPKASTTQYGVTEYATASEVEFPFSTVGNKAVTPASLNAAFQDILVQIYAWQTFFNENYGYDPGGTYGPVIFAELPNGFLVCAGTSSTGASGTATILFPRGFTAKPHVMVSEANAAGWYPSGPTGPIVPTVHGVYNVTNSSFTARSIYMDESGYYTGSAAFSWVAIGKS